jgi:O-antigen ligase
VLPTPEVFTGDFRTIVRVLTSSYAMVMALAFIAVLANQIIRGLQATGLLTAGIFGLFVLALQHRSVWTASVVGVAWLAFRTFRLANRRWIQVSLVAVPVIALGIAFLFVSGRADNVISLAKANIEETRQSNSTWAWRVDGFSEATDRALSNGLLDLAVGPPAGRDLTDVATEASIHIHDQYIATFAYYGVAGLLVFVVWMGMLARHIGRVGLSTLPSLCPNLPT